jgi:hypothetical protein|tara:strand:+ start:329 stop:1561 length:1233 start_codon:yes stop_codon:yes gene_type:complete
MGTSAGPNITSDALVVGYDTGYPISGIANAQSLRFNKGEPATNLFTVLGTPSNTDADVTFSVNGTGTFKRVADGTTIGDYIVKSTDVVYSYALGGTGCHYHGNDYSSVSSGTKVSFSIEYFLTGDVDIVSNYLGNFEQLSGVGGSWGSVSSVNNKWHRVSFTRTATSTGNLRMLMYPGACGSSHLSAQGTIYYKNPTVTLTPQPILFVSGTRSSTESLIDLKETTDINVAYVSFDSNGQPEFDGTDDYIDLGSDVAISPIHQGWTAEYVFNTDSASTLQHFNGCEEDVHNAGWLALLSSKLAVWNRDPGVWKYGSTTFASNTNYHVAFVQENGTSMQFYVNGVAEGGDHVSYSWNASKSAFFARYIGKYEFGGYSRYWNGHVPIARLYSKPLSASEIKQNFNAYKKRFGL